MEIVEIESERKVRQKISDRLFEAVKIIDSVLNENSEILRKDESYDELEDLSMKLFDFSLDYEEYESE